MLEQNKVDVGLVPQALNNTNVTGAYHPMRYHDELLAVLLVGAMAATKTAKLELYQATDATGSGGEAITGKSATGTANTLVNKATLTLATVLAADTVTINGLVFTAHASTTTKASRQFSIAGTDAQDATELAACINDTDYGVPGVLATVNSNVITLTSTEPGETTITVATSGSTVTLATVEAAIAVPLLAEEMKVNEATPFTHVAAKVTVTANTTVSVLFIRNNQRYQFGQALAATGS
jgi:hypothetical protein